MFNLKVEANANDMHNYIFGVGTNKDEEKREILNNTKVEL